MNNKLSVAIPTYNRAKILCENLGIMLPDLIKYNVPVYISDDGDGEETELMLKELQKEYTNIFYSKNRKNIGHDDNCLKTLSMPTSDYVWYLGDAMFVKSGGIKKILDLIDRNEFDFLAVNDENRPPICINSKIYSCPSDLLSEIGWHLTLSGATIYNKKFLVNLEANCRYFRSTNFMQLGIVLAGFPNGVNGLCWINEKLVSSSQAKTSSYWNTKVFTVFARDWSRFVMSLSDDDYSLDSKITAIKMHSKMTGIFEIGAMVKYRINGLLNLKVVFENWRYLKLSSNVNIVYILFLSVIPRWMFKSRKIMKLICAT